MTDFVFSNSEGTVQFSITVNSMNDNLGGQLQVMDVKGVAPDSTLEGLVKDVTKKGETLGYDDIIDFATTNNWTLKQAPQNQNDSASTKNTATALAITSTDPLAGGNDSVAYEDTVETEGGVGALTFTLSSGSLPTGLSLDAETGVISGTPTVVENPTFEITVTDELGTSVALELSIDIAA